MECHLFDERLTRSLFLSITADKRHVTLKDLIKYILQALVDHPEQVKVSEFEGKQSAILEVKVAQEDIGKIIGKQGRTVKAIRTILNAASGKKKTHTIMEIVE